MNAENASSKRPASHKWALFAFVASATTNIVLNLQGWFDTIGVLLTGCSLLAVFCFLRFARSHRTYFLGVITLGLVFVRSVQSWWFDVRAFLSGWRFGLLPILLIAGVVVLLFMLWRAYTIGTASRRYYGLPPVHLGRRTQSSPASITELGVRQAVRKHLRTKPRNMTPGQAQNRLLTCRPTIRSGPRCPGTVDACLIFARWHDGYTVRGSATPCGLAALLKPCAVIRYMEEFLL